MYTRYASQGYAHSHIRVRLIACSLINPKQSVGLLHVALCWAFKAKLPAQNRVKVKCEFYVGPPPATVWCINFETGKQAKPICVRVTGAVNFNYAHSSAHKLLLLWQRGASIWTPFPIRSTRPHSTQTSRHPFALTSHIHIHNQIAIKWAKAWLRINDNGVSVAMCGKWAGGGKWSLNRSEVQSNKTN